MNKAVNFLKKNWIVVTIVLVIILLIVFWNDIFGTSSNTDLPPVEKDPEKWAAAYIKEYNKLMGYAGTYRDKVQQKADAAGRTYKEQAHADAVWVVNKQFGTSVDKLVWNPNL